MDDDDDDLAALADAAQKELLSSSNVVTTDDIVQWIEERIGGQLTPEKLGRIDGALAAHPDIRSAGIRANLAVPALWERGYNPGPPKRNPITGR